MIWFLAKGERRLEQIFQLAPVYQDGNYGGAPGYAERLDNGIARTANPNLGNIVIAPTDTAGLEVELRRGKTLSYELAYLMNRSLPTALNVVLFPLPPREEMSPEIRLIDLAVDADVLATGFSVAHGEFTDVVLISDDGFAEICTFGRAISRRIPVSACRQTEATPVVRDDKRTISQMAGERVGRSPEPQESYAKRLGGSVVKQKTGGGGERVGRDEVIVLAHRFGFANSGRAAKYALKQGPATI